MSTDVYQIVTDKILEQLAQGTVPWHKPWKDGARPTNLVSNKPYTGINVFLLGTEPYASPYWLTYKQATELGGHVRKGEHGTLIIFWQLVKARKQDQDADRDPNKPPRMVPLLRYYRVFNLEQTEDVKVPKGRTAGQVENRTEIERIEAAEEIIANYPNRPHIQYGEAAAWYRVTDDLVNLPPKDLFENADEFYATAFHELGHSTGHPDRLDRLEPAFFGSHTYGREELVAEMTAAFLAAEAGIETTHQNNAAYLASWIKTIGEDVKAVVVAAGQAQKAADHVLGRVKAEETETEQQPELVAA